MIKLVVLVTLLLPLTTQPSQPASGSTQMQDVTVVVVNDPLITIFQPSEDSAYFLKRYELLSNEFHRMLDEDELSEGRLQLLLSSARDFEQKTMQAKDGHWNRQFKVLSNSISVAMEVCRAEREKK